MLVPNLVQSQRSNPKNELTERELDVLQLLVAEKTNAQIAQALDIAERTVRHHLQSIYGKLEVKTRVGAVVQAIKMDLIHD